MNTWYSFNRKSIKFERAVICILVLAGLLFHWGCTGDDTALRMNDLQMIGSHNSYKKAIQPELIEMIKAQDSSIINLNYEHLPVTSQLEMGIRKLELDVYHDPDGGRFADPLGNQLMASNDIAPYPLDHLDDWTEPGFKVFHVQDIDFRSHCMLLTQCLRSITEWSDSHPNHLPIVITLNVKTDSLDSPDSIIPLAFTEEVYRQLDDTFKSALGIGRLITPKSITKPGITLNASIKDRGWPLLDDVAGKFVLVLDEPMDKINTYMTATTSEDRILFANLPPGHEASAFIIANDPIAQENDIKKWVSEGYLVRTRADANTQEAMMGDYSRFEAAKRSGAHFISTDYYYKTSQFPDFTISFQENTFVRCNPLRIRTGCAKRLNKL